MSGLLTRDHWPFRQKPAGVTKKSLSSTEHIPTSSKPTVAHVLERKHDTPESSSSVARLMLSGGG